MSSIYTPPLLIRQIHEYKWVAARKLLEEKQLPYMIVEVLYAVHKTYYHILYANGIRICVVTNDNREV